MRAGDGFVVRLYDQKGVKHVVYDRPPFVAAEGLDAGARIRAAVKERHGAEAAFGPQLILDKSSVEVVNEVSL